MNNDVNLSPDGNEPSRRAFLALGPAALTSIAVTHPFLTGRTIMASESGKAMLTPVSKDSPPVVASPWFICRRPTRKSRQPS